MTVVSFCRPPSFIRFIIFCSEHRHFKTTVSYIVLFLAHSKQWYLQPFIWILLIIVWIALAVPVFANRSETTFFANQIWLSKACSVSMSAWTSFSDFRTCICSHVLLLRLIEYLIIRLECWCCVIWSEFWKYVSGRPVQSF